MAGSICLGIYLIALAVLLDAVHFFTRSDDWLERYCVWCLFGGGGVGCLLGVLICC